MSSRYLNRLFAVSSDWHLKLYNWAAYPDLRGDSFRSAKFIVNYCLNHKLPLFVLGDITDKKDPDPVTVGLLMDLIQDMTDAGLQFFFLQGQHELNRTRPWASCHRWATHIHKQTAAPISPGPVCYGLDFLPEDNCLTELSNLPDSVDILMAHQVWKERMGSTGGKYIKLAFADIPKVNMVISGDYHSHIITEHEGKDGQKLTAVSPGSTFLKTLDESPDKYFFTVDSDQKLKSIRIPTRPVEKIRVGTSDSLDKFLADMTKKYDKCDSLYEDKPIWSVEYRDSIPDAAERLTQVASGRAHLFYKPLYVKKDKEQKEVDSVVGDINVDDLFNTVYPSESDSHKVAKRLWDSPNQIEELQDLTKEVIAEADKASKSTNVWESSDG